ncbi:MAG: NYN domain-containing protein [Candidatus Margulisbacteria bacterium]|nr:NYN domain-containing protein [Candidatus Margulisiibacteriota bacterium]
MKSVVCFIDGYNLYHAINNLGKNFNYLKWLDIPRLMSFFTDSQEQKINAVYYFSAYADWKISCERHKLYVRALVERGVIPIMGRFKTKDRECLRCHTKWKGHEEKETDVNMALHILKMAFYKEYDEAFVVTQDSDIAPALKMIKQVNTLARIKVITPPNIRHSRELIRVADKAASIKIGHLKNSLFPKDIVNSRGDIVLTRPVEYAPAVE